MKFDTIIIGGGLSGLSCGIRLAESGVRVALCAGGESSLVFSAGNIDLLGAIGGERVARPLEHLHRLPAEHPYSIIGEGRTRTYAAQLADFYANLGLEMRGCEEENQMRLTPLGLARPTWLQPAGMAAGTWDGAWPWRRVALVGIEGMLDFPIDMVAYHLDALGLHCDCKLVATEATRCRRRSCTEMRATSLARVFRDEKALAELAEAINGVLTDEVEAVLMPEITSFADVRQSNALRRMVQKPLFFLPTMPPVAMGHALTAMLRRRFESLGGTYLNGEMVREGRVENGRVVGIVAERLEDDVLVADHYVLATGSFMGGGLVATPNRVEEAVFGLDVCQVGTRATWVKEGLLADQPYMYFGVAVDDALRPSKEGQLVENLHVVGSLLSGHNRLETLDGEGVDLISAFYAADLIKAMKK